MQIPVSDITAVLLAGGKGSRLNNLDKGLVKLVNKPLIEYVIAGIRAQVENLIISANRNINVYQQFGYPVVTDKDRNYNGPLAGILAAMDICQTNWLLTLPVDCPFVTANLAENLGNNVENEKVIIAADPEFLQPAFSLIHMDCYPSLKTFLHQGHRKTRQWLKQQPHKVVVFENETNAFFNINSQSELEQAIQLLS